MGRDGKGMGSQKILGRVHLVRVQKEADFLACSFSVLEEEPVEVLPGLACGNGINVTLTSRKMYS